MAEAQYVRLLDWERASLGLMSNQVWQQDPKRLGIMLARYKFVSKMLAGRQVVAEVGCGDAFGSRVVRKEVGRLTVFDFDRRFLNDINEREGVEQPAYYADILDGALPGKFDAVYSLDVIEHISVTRERDYVANLAGSLWPHGVAIVGTPSLESQPYASPMSKAGHVNCFTGERLRSLMGEFFHAVFIFGMNDEVVHTGFLPMCHYLFAVCAEAK
jgi:2-polyprenyl-3-methyl-5-hydroxy-6-metoxy-1,4-benzoquinol methylase